MNKSFKLIAYVYCTWILSCCGGSSTLFLYIIKLFFFPEEVNRKNKNYDKSMLLFYPYEEANKDMLVMHKHVEAVGQACHWDEWWQ